MLRDVNFTYRIHPAVKSDTGEQKWVTGFHNELSLCVKCCRMVDSVPRWQLSVPRSIQSDHLSIADYDDTTYRSWREHKNSKTQYIPGPGEVMTVENKQIRRC